MTWLCCVALLVFFVTDQMSWIFTSVISNMDIIWKCCIFRSTLWGNGCNTTYHITMNTRRLLTMTIVQIVRGCQYMLPILFIKRLFTMSIVHWWTIWTATSTNYIFLGLISLPKGLIFFRMTDYYRLLLSTKIINN